MISLYSHGIILVLFMWIIKQDNKNKYLVTGDWSQSIVALCHVIVASSSLLSVPPESCASLLWVFLCNFIYISTDELRKLISLRGCAG